MGRMMHVWHLSLLAVTALLLCSCSAQEADKDLDELHLMLHGMALERKSMDKPPLLCLKNDVCLKNVFCQTCCVISKGSCKFKEAIDGRICVIPASNKALCVNPKMTFDDAKAGCSDPTICDVKPKSVKDSLWKKDPKPIAGTCAPHMGRHPSDHEYPMVDCDTQEEAFDVGVLRDDYPDWNQGHRTGWNIEHTDGNQGREMTGGDQENEIDSGHWPDGSDLREHKRQHLAKWPDGASGGGTPPSQGFDSTDPTHAGHVSNAEGQFTSNPNPNNGYPNTQYAAAPQGGNNNPETPGYQVMGSQVGHAQDSYYMGVTPPINNREQGGRKIWRGRRSKNILRQAASLESELQREPLKGNDIAVMALSNEEYAAYSKSL